jgi:hypothetical protein
MDLDDNRFLITVGIPEDGLLLPRMVLTPGFSVSCFHFEPAQQIDQCSEEVETIA